MTDSNTNKLDKWIAYTKPDPNARLRLFCFPFAGGGASTFRHWPKKLAPEIDVCPVQLPGRETRLMEKPIADLSGLVQILAENLSPYLNVPFAFFGHSMGALISFEFARYLRKNNHAQPTALFVSAYQAPPRPNKLPPIHHLEEAEFVAGLRRFKYTPELVLQNSELLELLLPALRADFSLYERYENPVEEPLSCRIAAIGGLHDELADKEDLEAWRAHTKGSFSVQIFPGDHFYLNEAQEPILRLVSEELAMQASGLNA